jgi:hypothetical protein
MLLVAGRLKRQYWPKFKDTELPYYMDGYHHVPYTAWRHDITLPPWTRKPTGVSTMLLSGMVVESSRILKHGTQLPFAENVWNITSTLSNTFIAYFTEGITLPLYVLRPSIWGIGRERMPHVLYMKSSHVPISVAHASIREAPLAVIYDSSKMWPALQCVLTGGK